jgi:hypothetical protein
VKRKLFHSTKLVPGASGTLSLHTKDNSPEAPDTNFFSVMSFTCSTSHQKLDCQNVLVQFFFKVKDKLIRWVLVIASAAGAVNSNAESLSNILGIDYDATYIPFMISAGVISQKVHNCWKTNVLTTNIAERKAFIVRNSLSVEISYMCCNQGSKAHYVSIGSFHHTSFTIKLSHFRKIWDHYRLIIMKTYTIEKKIDTTTTINNYSLRYY